MKPYMGNHVIFIPYSCDLHVVFVRLSSIVRSVVITSSLGSMRQGKRHVPLSMVLIG